jgi:hypothetical protein
MIKRCALLTVLALALGACGGGDEEGEEAEREAAGQACAEAPAALDGTPKLPEGFPTPDGVTYTAEREAGPSTIVDGYYEGGLEDAYEDYKSALEDADGYDVTQDEQEEVDAEVNFEGGGTSGQVKLIQECEDRTSVSITARPE